MAKYAMLRLRKDEVEAEPMTEVNIIPVIDISLVLLVILFVTAPLLSYPNHPIELPRASAKDSGDGAINITCTKDERLAVASVDVTWETLESTVAAELKRNPAAPIVLRVDKAVPYRFVQRLILSSKRAGGRSIALATEPYK